MKILCRLLFVILLSARTLFAADEAQPVSIPLWTNGAPGFENRRNEPELAKDYWIRNIHNPSVTVFLPPAEKATGAAVLICPGGGHRELVFKAEGVEPAQYLNKLGVTAFVLKYRLGREEGSPYSVDKHPGEDGRRAMKLLRSRATEWHIDPKRIGIMGFSAGGEVASMVAYGPTAGDTNAADSIDRMSCRPDFQIMIYPGPLGIPDVLPADAPPAFFLAANDDRGPARTISSLLPKYHAVGIPIEVHLFARGGHAFNMGYRSDLATIKGWPQRLADWMGDNHILRGL
jgi:acetyl esterase/lipase